MAWRKSLAIFLVSLAISPAWGAAEPLGNISASTGATVRNTKLTAGSTVYNGDVISVAEHGTTQIALSSGVQAEVLGNSSVKLTKAANEIQLIVNRGQASFRSSGANGISALVQDVTVRRATGDETSAVIQSLSPTRSIVAAQKGALLVTTAYDGKTYTVNEGQAADLSAALDTQLDEPQDSGPTPAGKSAPSVRPSHQKAVIWTVVIVSAAVAVTAYLLARREKTPSTTVLQNEISPAKLN